MNKKILMIFLIISIIFSGCSIVEKPNPNLYTGSVSGDEIVLKNELSGKIIEKNYIEGKNVNKGDVLYKIDPSDLKNELKKLEIKLEIAKLNYEDIKNGINESNLKASLSKIETIQKEINSTRENYDYYKNIYDDNLSLYNSGAISKEKLDASKHQLDSIENKIEILNEQKNTAVEQYNSLKNNFSYETIKKSEKEINMINQEIDNLKDQIEKFTIESPIDGNIQNLNYEEGELVQPYSNLASIINPENLYINIYIPEKYLKNISIGKKVTFTDEFLSEDVYGEIVNISNKAEFTPKNVESKESKQEMVFKTKISIKDSENVMPGMFLTVDISGDENE